MPRYPGARWVGPIPSSDFQAGPSPKIGLVVHVIVGSEDAADSEFHNATAHLSAHFGVAGPGDPDGDLDGAAVEWLDTDDNAYAQGAGNFPPTAYIAVEVAGTPDQPMTDAQVQTVGKIAAWASVVHGFPLEAVDHGGQGVTTHAHYPSGQADPAWGNHACPGAVRSAQLPDIIAAARAVTQPPQEDDMPRIVGGTPSWCPRQGDQAFPRHQALWETPTPGDFKTGNTIVASIDGAPFTPPHHDGQKDPAGAWEDFIWQGFWWRRWFRTGVPINFGEVAGVYFLDADNGTYDVALRP